MRWLILLFPIALATQPSERNQGRALYIANCSFCHGAKGDGGRGPNLRTAESTHGRSPQDLEGVIAKGVPGTPMPAFGHFEADEMKSLVSFVAGLSVSSVPAEKARGDAATGLEVYRKLKCDGCHRIGTEGSVFGPDLSRVGAGRPLNYLRESLENPSADILPQYEGVMVTARDGRRASGIRIGEDTFSIQIRDLSQQFLIFSKAEVKSVEASKQSLMPPYALPPRELDDLLAYLSSLRVKKAEGDSKQAEGIR